MWNTKKNDVVFIYKGNANANANEKEKERYNKYGMKVEMGDAGRRAKGANIQKKRARYPKRIV